MDVSLFDIAMCNTAYPAIWYLNEGHVQDRLARSAHPSLTPCQMYTTKDGWIYLMCNKEKFWPSLCKALGRDDWARDPRFATFKDRLANRGLIQRLLDEALGAKTTAAWLGLFAGSVPVAPINDIAQALDNPFVAERQGIQTINLDGYGNYRILAAPVLSGGAETPANPAPTLGQHTEEILRELGYDQARIETLRKAKTI